MKLPWSWSRRSPSSSWSLGCPPAGGGKALLTRQPWLDSFISRVKPTAPFHLLEDVEEGGVLPKELCGHLKQLHGSTALTVVLEGANLSQEPVTPYTWLNQILKIIILLFIWLDSLSTSSQSYCHNRCQCNHRQSLIAHQQDHTWPASFSTSSLSRLNAVFSSFTCLLFTTCRGLKSLDFDEDFLKMATRIKDNENIICVDKCTRAHHVNIILKKMV